MTQGDDRDRPARTKAGIAAPRLPSLGRLYRLAEGRRELECEA
jgi:hypothetical protein